MKPKPGQLRRWNRSDDDDYDKLFVVIGAELHENGFVWCFIQDGVKKYFHHDTIKDWSEVVSG